jgi:hypothetical protein
MVFMTGDRGSGHSTGPPVPEKPFGVAELLDASSRTIG